MDSSNGLWQDLKDAYGTAENFLANAPIVKAADAVINNPTPQEFGEQTFQLGKAVSEGLQKFTTSAAADPTVAGGLVAPIMGVIAWHGTNTNFDKFDYLKDTQGKISLSSKGSFFATNREGAKDYAWIRSGKDGKGYIKKVDLQLNNPFIYNGKGERFSNDRLGFIVDWAKEHGYDGVKITNIKGDIPQWVVWDMDKIKILKTDAVNFLEDK